MKKLRRNCDKSHIRLDTNELTLNNSPEFDFSQRYSSSEDKLIGFIGAGSFLSRLFLQLGSFRQMLCSVRCGQKKDIAGNDGNQAKF